MTPELIEKFVDIKKRKDTTVNIHFKDRQTVRGIFIQGKDYEELKSKNFWRIVNHQNVKAWIQTNDLSLAKIFNGAAFTRLSED
ncbi:MAG TPA: short-chain dehydrogenase [Chitinophagaceae bacterium]|nr:short-chain dehydrogenase [Chitinophagaceae bacterium]